MKRKNGIRSLMSLLLSAAMCLALLPAPARAEAPALTITEAKYKNGMVEMRLSTAPGAACVMIAASYDAKGRLLDLATRELTAKTTGACIELPEGAASYRAFVVDASTWKPLCKGAAAEDLDSIVKMKGRVSVPTLGGASAHATALAVDACVEAAVAKEKLLPLLSGSGEENRLGQIALNGTEEEKEEANALIQQALNALEREVCAAAVLDAAVEADRAVALSELQEASARLTLAAPNRKYAEALRWAQELSAKYDSFDAKGGKLKQLASFMGTDARTAYKALQDAQKIVSGQYNADADFWDFATRAAIFTKTAASVSVFVCATAMTCGTAAAAGGLAYGEAAGILVGTADACIQIERTTAQVILGDDHKVVQKIEDRYQTYDTVMFLYNVATFNPKEITMGEKLLFIEDLVEKDIDAYTNIQEFREESGEFMVDVIQLQTARENEANSNAQLKRAATELLPADKTGIIGVDPTLDGSAAKQVRDYTSNVDSGSDALTAACTELGVSLDAVTDSFKTACDATVTYRSIDEIIENGGEPGDDPGGGGAGTGAEGGGIGTGGEDGGGAGDDEIGEDGTDGEDGTGGTPTPPTEDNIPDGEEDPDLWVDYVEGEANGDTGWTERYYDKDGNELGYTDYRMDENGRYWPTKEFRKCTKDAWAVTEYYQKGDTWSYNWYGYDPNGDYGYQTTTLTAETWGIVRERYVHQTIYNFFDEPCGWSRYYYDDISYYPNGKIMDKYEYRGGTDETYTHYGYAPNGALAVYSEGGNNASLRLEYYVYKEQGPVHPNYGTIIFDPTGHLSRKYASGVSDVEYRIGSQLERTVTDSQGHTLYYIEKYGYTVLTNNDWNHTGFIPVRTVTVYPRN